MADPIIRPRNGVLLIALQAAEGTPATLDPALHAVPFEDGSITFNNPYRTEDTSEVNGSFVASAPLVIGQPATFGFRSRLKGAGAGVAYTSSVKPPIHAALQACGARGQFTAAIAAAALTAGGQTSATLGTGFSTSVQAYRGMPLILSGAVAPGRMPLIIDYSGAGKFATLSDLYSTALTTSTLAAMPANWSYARTSPADNTARLTDHPCATIGYYEDGNFYKWTDCRGVFDMDGASARPGFFAPTFTGVWAGLTAAAVPNATVASHSAPILVQGAGVVPAFQMNGSGLPVSRWSITNGGGVESPDDPNTFAGFQAGQIGGRTPVIEADPLMATVSVRNSLNEISAGALQIISIQLGTTAGNRVSILPPFVQPVDAQPGVRGSQRSETRRWQAINVGDDAYGRDSDLFVAFS